MDAVRLAPATDLQHLSTRRGAPANPPRRQRLCMLHLLRISLACLMTLTSAQSTATTPAATPPSALSPTPLSAPTAARSSPQPPAVPLDLSPLSRSEGSRTSLPLWAPPTSPPAADPSPSPPPLSPAPAATLVALPSSSGSLPWPSTGNHYLDRKVPPAASPPAARPAPPPPSRRPPATSAAAPPLCSTTASSSPVSPASVAPTASPGNQSASNPLHPVRILQRYSTTAKGGKLELQTGSDHRPPRLRLASPPWSLRHRR